MTPWLLAVLVMVDGTLCGFRAAAGRNPRIRLRDYYAASMRRGALVSVFVVLAFLGVALAMRSHSPEAWSALLVGAHAMVVVYGVFATLVLSALALYLVGSFDFAVLASVLVLGPFTLIRPIVIIGGAVFAAWSSQHLGAASFCLSAGAVMVSFERLLALGSPPWRGLLPE